MRYVLRGLVAAAAASVGCGDSDSSSAPTPSPETIRLEVSLESWDTVSVKAVSGIAPGREYVLERSVNGSDFAAVGTLTSERAAISDGLLPKESGVVYRARVRGQGEGSRSTEAKAVTAWSKTYGGPGSEDALSSSPTADGGVLVIGETDAYGVGGYDAWLLKLDATGELEWSRSLGGPDSDWLNYGCPTPDGGTILVGEYGYDWSQLDAWVVKLDAEGRLTWDARYGTPVGTERFHSVVPSADGGYVMAGTRSTVGNDEFDIWLVKVDADGAIVWQRAYGGDQHDKQMRFTMQMDATTEGGYILTCATASFSKGLWDYWILKVDADGNRVWDRAVGEAGYDGAKVTRRAAGGGYWIGGSSSSFGAGGLDYWILRLDEGGNIRWQMMYGGAGEEWLYAIEPLPSGGCVLAGTTTSFGAGQHDYWFLEIDDDGAIRWQRTYGGVLDEDTYAMSLSRTADQGFLFAGRIESAGTGPSDVWVMKLAADGSIAFSPESNLFSSDTHVTPIPTTAVLRATTARTWTPTEPRRTTDSVFLDTVTTVLRQ